MSATLDQQKMNEALREKILLCLKRNGPLTFGGIRQDVLLATSTGSERAVDRAVQHLRKSGRIKLNAYRQWTLAEPDSSGADSESP